MSKALVIKQGDFSTNKLATVTLSGSVPCTGISLDESSATVTDTLTLTATVTPSNTTDTVTWSSSDNSVATVSNGVVTAVASGTATITVTCGTQTATCTVAVDISVSLKSIDTGYLNVRVYSSKDKIYDYAGYMTASLGLAVGATSGTYPAAGMSSTTEEERSIYPIPIPSGAKTINLTCGSNYAPLMVYFSKNTLATEVPSGGYDCAKVLDGQTTSGGSPWSITSFTYGSQTIQIPDTEGIDSFTISFDCKNAAAKSNFDVDDIGIEFGYA